MSGDAQSVDDMDGVIFTNTNTEGEVRVNAFLNPCRALSGNNRLFELPFNILGESDEVSPLEFTTASIYDDSQNDTVALTLKNGSLTVGTVFARGDVDGDGMVTGADSSQAMAIGTQEVTATALQRTACDINGDGDCASSDAVKIACYVEHQSWQCPESTRSLAANALSTADPVEIEIGSFESQADGTIVFPVLRRNGYELAGGDLTILYDPSKMSVVGVATTSLTPSDDFQLVANFAEQGVLRVAFASANPIGADGAILQLQFLPTDGISNLDFGQIRLNNRLGRDFVTSLACNASSISSRMTKATPLSPLPSPCKGAQMRQIYNRACP